MYSVANEKFQCFSILSHGDLYSEHSNQLLLIVLYKYFSE